MNTSIVFAAHNEIASENSLAIFSVALGASLSLSSTYLANTEAESLVNMALDDLYSEEET
jgi:hypothetical protein